MSHYTGGTIEIVYPHHNPNEGRDIWNRNFRYVEDAIHFSITGSTSAHTQVDGSSNITVLSSGATVPPIYTVYLNDDITLSSISAATINGGTILSGGTDLYDIFVSGTSGDLWSSSTGSNSIIANNGTGNLASGVFSIVVGANNSATTTHSSVGGGYQNLSSGYASTILGGRSNSATSSYSTSSGYNNLASGPRSFVGGGQFNKATNAYSSIIGGQSNKSYGYGTFVGGGISNLALGNRSFVGSGSQNSATTTYASVVGGYRNLASGYWSSVVGGDRNLASGQRSFVGSGMYNSATAQDSSIVSGYRNLASGIRSSVVGGRENSATTIYSSVVGGQTNLASANHAFIGGGLFNLASGNRSSIIGGISNSATTNNSTIAGGQENISSSAWSFIGGGRQNSVSGSQSSAIAGSGNTISGLRSVVLGGQSIIGSANDTAYVPNLNINITPSNNNTLTQILARDIDGTIKYRDAASIISGATSASTLSQVLTNGNIMLDSQSILSEDGFGELKMGFDYNGGFETYLYRAQNLTGESRVGLYTDGKGFVLWDTEDGNPSSATLYSDNIIFIKNGSSFTIPNDTELLIENSIGPIKLFSNAQANKCNFILSESGDANLYVTTSGDTLLGALTIDNVGRTAIGGTNAVVMTQLETTGFTEVAKVEIAIDSTINIQTTLSDINIDGLGVHINTPSSVTLPGVLNSVILGGSNITASTNNTVYVSNLSVQSGGTINSTSGGGQLNLNNNGDGNVLLTTDSGSGGETGLDMNPTTITMFSNGYDKGFYLGENESEWWNQDANEDNQQMKITLGNQKILWAHNNTNFDRTNIQGVFYAALALNASNPTFLSGVSNSVIIGGENITANTSSTVYVPYLNIGLIQTGTSIASLGIDSSGNIVTGGTTSIQKYAASASLTASTTSTITHNLGTTDIQIQIKDSTGALIIPNTVDNYLTNSVDVNVSVTDIYRIIIIG